MHYGLSVNLILSRTHVNKKRTYISRVENDGSNLTLKTLFDIVEKGLGGKVQISIDL